VLTSQRLATVAAHGLTSTKLGGKILASLVLKVDEEWSRMPVVGAPLVKLPPEPLRCPMIQSVTWAYEARDRAHEEGRMPGLVPRSVIAAYGSYGAHSGAVRDD